MKFTEFGRNTVINEMKKFFWNTTTAEEVANELCSDFVAKSDVELYRHASNYISSLGDRLRCDFNHKYHSKIIHILDNEVCISDEVDKYRIKRLELERAAQEIFSDRINGYSIIYCINIFDRFVKIVARCRDIEVHTNVIVDSVTPYKLFRDIYSILRKYCYKKYHDTCSIVKYAFAEFIFKRAEDISGLLDIELEYEYKNAISYECPHAYTSVWENRRYVFINDAHGHTLTSCNLCDTLTDRFAYDVFMTKLNRTIKKASETNKVKDFATVSLDLFKAGGSVSMDIYDPEFKKSVEKAAMYYKRFGGSTPIKPFERVEYREEKEKINMKKLNMKVVLEKWAKKPEYAHDTDAGMDLFLPIDSYLHLTAGESCNIDTGVCIEIPEGYYISVESKSGLCFNQDIVVEAGIIDTGYTGPIHVKLRNNSDNDVWFLPGDKIAQMILHEYVHMDLEVVEKLGDTERGKGGFGSTGRS